MSYDIRYERTAINSLKAIQKSIRQRIVKKIEWLSENGDAINHIPLQANLSDFYKLRVRDYRVIYELDKQQKIIIIDLVGHRREIYKQ